jgi:endonuclease I
MISKFLCGSGFRASLVVVAVVLATAAPARAVLIGDVAVISFASDDPDRVSFVVLREIPAGTAIRFTDSGWTAAGAFRANEGGVQYTAAAALPAGTVVTATNPFTTGGWSINGTGLGSGGFSLSTTGDQILTFVGDAASPQFIHCVHFDSTGYTDATTSNTTALPTGLSIGSSAVLVAEADNGYYSGPTTGTPESLLAAIGSASNWTTSDNPLTLPSWTFTVSGGAPVVTGVSVGGSNFDIDDTAAITVTLNSAPAAGQPVTVQLTSGAFAAPQSLVISDPDSSGIANVSVVNEGIWTVGASATSGGSGSATSSNFTVGSPVFAPTAYAGADRHVQLSGSVAVVQLFDATGDDLDGVATYAWTPLTAPGIVGWQNRTGTIAEANDPGSAWVTLDALGNYTLTLTVTDDDELVSSDSVTIHVIEPIPPDEDEFAAPAGYYDSATGVGAALKMQLAAILTAGHTQQTYGAFKNSAARYDADPNHPGNILLAYNRASVASQWNGGFSWNREHVWPQSLQPGEAGDSTKGNLGDPYVLRPSDPGINSSRGNKPFGNLSTIGVYGSLGAFYFPGDPDKGDMARGLFYSATRYMSELSLVNGVPSGNTMGDLASLVRWNYTDTPDTFERRRGHLIFVDQGNRNPYIDHPEYVWSIFGDGANDSTLYVSALEPIDGVSSLMIELPPVIVGGPNPAPTNVVLQKSGVDPTYYSVTTSGDATCDVSGRYNAFDFNAGQRTMTVGLAASTASAGVATGSVVVDNLDISSQGVGQGSVDGDDFINLSLTVFAHAEASFSAGSDADAVIVDLGMVPAGAGVQMGTFEIHNLPAASGPTAHLDIESVQSSGDSDVLMTDAAAYAGLAPGSSLTFNVAFDPTGLPPASYSATYTFAVADENLPGGAAGVPLVLTLSGTVIAVPSMTFDSDGDDDVDDVDLVSFISCLNGPGGGLVPASCAIHDADEDNDVDFADASGFQRAFTGPLP